MQFIRCQLRRFHYCLPAYQTWVRCGPVWYRYIRPVYVTPGKVIDPRTLLSTYLPTYLPIHLLAYTPIYLPYFLPTYLPTLLSSCLFTHLPTSLPTCPPSFLTTDLRSLTYRYSRVNLSWSYLMIWIIYIFPRDSTRQGTVESRASNGMLTS